MKKFAVCRAMVLGILFTGCLGVSEEITLPVEPAESEIATQTQTDAPTTVWFPPTQTPQPINTVPPSPTPYAKPALGELLVSDDFTDSSIWNLFQSSSGSAALGVNELTIVLNAPRSYISATRNDLFLTDYFLEITISTSLCSGLDEYGMLLRVASAADFYRLSMSCNGQFRMDLIRGGSASSPLTWTESRAVPNNAPATVRLGVWSDGDLLHFYINDKYQTTVSSPVLSNGTIGFFARSAGENAVTVNYRDMQIWAVSD